MGHMMCASKTFLGAHMKWPNTVPYGFFSTQTIRKKLVSARVPPELQKHSTVAKTSGPGSGSECAEKFYTIFSRFSQRTNTSFK